MHAPLILLDCVLALRARLRVELDPVFCVFIAAPHSVKPLAQQLAVHGRVGGLVTKETELRVTPITADVENNIVCLLFDYSVAAGARTVLVRLVVESNVGGTGKALIFIVQIRGQELFENGLGNDHVAFLVWTEGKDTFDTLFHLGYQVLSIALVAKEVTAVVDCDPLFRFAEATRAQRVSSEYGSWLTKFKPEQFLDTIRVFQE